MQIKRMLSIILTVSIVATSFPLVIKAKEQTEEETVSSVTQVVEDIKEIEDKLQTAPKPAEITDHFEIDSKDTFIKFVKVNNVGLLHNSYFVFVKYLMKVL